MEFNDYHNRSALILARSVYSSLFPPFDLEYLSAMPTQLLLALCTVPDHGTALSIAEQLVDQGVAACVNITSPITSVYRWKGKIESNDELLLLIKTTQAQYQKLETLIRSLHPYELPEIIAVPVEQGLNEYLNWVEQCILTNS